VKEKDMEAKDQDKDDAGCLLESIAFAIWPVQTAISAICGGFVFRKLWAWFMAPTFGLPRLGLAAAIGICITANMLRIGVSAKDDRSFLVTVLLALFIGVAAPSILLLEGYVVHLFM
jgi:hypothetical protein